MKKFKVIVTKNGKHFKDYSFETKKQCYNFIKVSVNNLNEKKLIENDIFSFNIKEIL